ncbi:MAG: hypothetical protein U1F36_07590 [Planctomycetota bacterium]
MNTHRLRIPARPWVVVLLLLPAACGRGRLPLCERESFAGEVTIRAERGSEVHELHGTLAFDRAKGTLSWASERDGHRIELRHGVQAGLSKSIDGAAAEPGAEDLADFTLLQQITAAAVPSGAELRWEERGYVIQLGEQRITVKGLPAGG